MNYLIINADDFGLCSSVNSAIIELYLEKKISSATLMVNTQGTETALKSLQSRELLDMPVGLHFNIVRGKSIIGKSSITDSDGYFLGRKLLFKKMFMNKVKLKDILDEFNFQLNFLKNNNIKLSHIDSDNHVLSHPKIFSCLSEKIIKSNLPCRSLKPLKYVNFLKKPKRFAQQVYLYLSFIKNHSKLIKSNDYLVSVYDSNDNKIDKYTYRNILDINQRNSLIELMVHPYIESKYLYEIYKSNLERNFLQKCIEEYSVIKDGGIYDNNKFRLVNYNFLNQKKSRLP